MFLNELRMKVNPNAANEGISTLLTVFLRTCLFTFGCRVKLKPTVW